MDIVQIYNSKLMAYDEFVSFLCYKQIDFNVWKVRILQKKEGLHYLDVLNA